ncbi:MULTISPECIES: transporter substrate-binding domain-containing protein [Rhizobium]|uniref:transporter substrate-binding domain-containing protein n=1 Tax=Rhizobium TaxID=379 RepID=UPI0016174999|nr:MULTISPECIES: transporter substrate-binding domain-containing protein [Rhizobium]MBB6305582.1 polar amino acid transport system substrate-binding protein [Rhizobium leucaenae]MDK4743624.1 transporter substrate-binding domain-containing protein [Rhizobium sp. CNPSo 3464]
MNRFLARLAATAAVALLSLACSVSAHAGEVLDRVLAKKTLTVATSVGWPPASFVNDKGELDGFDVEVAKGVAKYLGVNIKFVTPDWNIVTSAKWEGRWDLTMGQMVPTKARAEKFDFPGVYIYYNTVAVVHKDSKATKPADLNGKLIGVTAGSSEESYAKHTLEIYGAPPVQYEFTPGEVRSYEGTPSASDDLRLGDGVRLDGWVTDDQGAKQAIKSGYPLKIIGASLAATPGAIAILKGDKEFNDKVAEAIKSMRDDGTLSKISLKWYGSDYTTGK